MRLNVMDSGYSIEIMIQDGPVYHFSESIVEVSEMEQLIIIYPVNDPTKCSIFNVDFVRWVRQS